MRDLQDVPNICKLFFKYLARCSCYDQTSSLSHLQDVPAKLQHLLQVTSKTFLIRSNIFIKSTLQHVCLLQVTCHMFLIRCKLSLCVYMALRIYGTPTLCISYVTFRRSKWSTFRCSKRSTVRCSKRSTFRCSKRTSLNMASWEIPGLNGHLHKWENYRNTMWLFYCHVELIARRQALRFALSVLQSRANAGGVPFIIQYAQHHLFCSTQYGIYLDSRCHSSLHRPFPGIRLHIPSFVTWNHHMGDFICLPKGWKAATSSTTERPWPDLAPLDMPGIRAFLQAFPQTNNETPSIFSGV